MKEISTIIDKWEIEKIEKHLIHFYLNQSNIDYSQSSIIVDYFKGFKVDHQLSNDISNLSFNNIKELENLLELLIPKDDRKLNGAFFTPKYIVDYIIQSINPRMNDVCLDPSCGCGAFLIGLLDYFRNNSNRSVREIVKENIWGSDILDYNIRRSRLILTIYGLENQEYLEESDFNLINQDSLKSTWKNKFDIVVGNPPYVKYQDLSDENRSYLITNWETIEIGTFNIYFAFFELGYNLLKEEGKLGYITPNNYFTSLAGISLRSFFTEKKCLYKVIDFKDRKVFAAQTYTCLTFLSKQENDTIGFDRINGESDVKKFLNNTSLSSNKLLDLSVKKWRLLKSDEQQNIRNIENIGTPIRELFNIAVGIATLKDDVFFVDGKIRDGKYLIKEVEGVQYKIEREITQSVYKISKFKNQQDLAYNTLRIITPYNIVGNSYNVISEDEFRKKYPNCYEYLISQKKVLATRSKGNSNFDPFYLWGRTQGITRTGNMILTPTFSKRPRFLLVDHEDAYFTNGYGIYFKDDKGINSSLFQEEVHLCSKSENIDVVQKILNSSIMDYYITTTSVSIQGGFPCYQKNFIEKFTIPSLNQESIDRIRLLSIKEEIDEYLIDLYQLKIPNLSLSL